MLIDTHVLIWMEGDPNRIPAAIHRRLQGSGSIAVSSVTCLELSTLAAKGRLTLNLTPHAILRGLENDPRFTLVPLSPQMAVTTFDLYSAGFHGDPADRMIYATALQLRLPLATADQKIRDFAAAAPGHLKVECIWN